VGFVGPKGVVEWWAVGMGVGGSRVSFCGSARHENDL